MMKSPGTVGPTQSVRGMMEDIARRLAYAAEAHENSAARSRRHGPCDCGSAGPLHADACALFGERDTHRRAAFANRLASFAVRTASTSVDVLAQLIGEKL